MLERWHLPPDITEAVRHHHDPDRAAGLGPVQHRRALLLAFAHGVAQLEEALTAADRPHVNEIYAGAAHGYTMADTSMYSEAAAERHFAALQGLLERTIA